MAKNQALSNAAKAKKDEFYTQLVDIEKEMKYYRDYFKGKTVFLNCDDPYESNFFKYFAMNFNRLGLKKLISTCYAGSPVAQTQLSLFDDISSTGGGSSKQPYKIEITEVSDENNDGKIDLSDVEYLIKNKKNALTVLEGDGDFRSPECVALLDEADVVITNPPFSLFRKYLAQLVEHEKDFIILGNQNAITYKEVFPLIMNNKIWLGASIHSGDREFRVPNDYPLNAAGCRVDEDGNKYIRVKGIRWFTNVDYKQRHEPLILVEEYTPEKYFCYENYDAINVDKTLDIPVDYDGVMGVPITFLDKYDPDQFEIVGASLFDAKPIKDCVDDSERFQTGGLSFYTRKLTDEDKRKGFTLHREYFRILVRILCPEK
ncbi:MULTISPECIES: adenine-specific methyltransferase EcoRI family protein [unclassified Adlercreutzia]|uniref:adenine-specific methyltransferase EcoRI family protein n=1 Tax=unclassified Adlercreutzia TaxID=2636013 RepID=UPI0013EBECC0|nr:MULTISPECIES: adenine-specific methyltransferase EcoRI family protein [unclassified Adlercreutzia]